MKHMKTTILATIILLSFCTSSFAKDDSVIYRHRADWVKLVELSNKQLAGNQLLHPCSSVSTAQMTAMLMSLKIDKSELFKKDLKSSEVFSAEEAQKYAPLITQALIKAAPNEVVNVAIVHKRPYFIVRNDYFSLINIFITDQGVHFNFSKLFAKLTAEYAQASKIDAAINSARTSRTSLAAVEGQTLVADADEVILDPNFDFGQGASVPIQTAPTTQVTPTKTSKTTPTTTVTTTIVPDTSTTDDVTTRLTKLEELKKAKLITSKEYEAKKKEILSEL